MGANVSVLAVSRERYSISGSTPTDEWQASAKTTISESFSRVGWIPDTVEYGELLIDFTDLRAVETERLLQQNGWSYSREDPALRPGLFPGLSGVAFAASLPFYGQTTLPLVQVNFNHRAERLYVQGVRIAGREAEIWKESVVAEGDLKPCPLGHGFVGGPTAVIVADATLIRATWSANRPADLDNRT
ncbi:MAG: hypothetical protein ACRD1T_10930, partial [Acidimicrobiia bacterium]